MEICIFLGPTLPVEEARAVLDATYLPPASQGDIFRVVATTGTRLLGIVDGHFQQVPSIWHKEILWALDQGVHVLGAASMGALRAAELAEFGMVGEGRIFEAYRSGSLEPCSYTPFEDDDEVAIIHGPADLGYRPLSDALVDIRCTLDRAVRARVLSAACRDRLAALAKSCFYADRSWEAILDLGARDGCPLDELRRLGDWLPHGRVSQKKEDALALLRRIAAGDISECRPQPFDFQHTTLWDRFTTEALAPCSDLSETGLPDEECSVLSEFRLLAGEFLRLKSEAERKLRIGSCPPVRRTALAMLDQLRVKEWYPDLAARAAHKRSWLAARDPLPLDGLSGLQTLQLTDWYFGRRLGREMPDDVQAFAQCLGYSSRRDFLKAVFEEYAFTVSEGESGTGSGA